jgi:hypothetical protein
MPGGAGGKPLDGDASLIAGLRVSSDSLLEISKGEHYPVHPDGPSNTLGVAAATRDLLNAAEVGRKWLPVLQADQAFQCGGIGST